MVLWQQVAVSGLWGGLLAIERRAFLQAMFSRPIVAATGMGLLLDDVASGLFIGMLLELFYLGSASLGAAIPDNDTLAATGAAAASAGLAHASGGGSTPAIWSLAILLFIGLGRVGRYLDRRLERHSSHLARRAVERALEGDLDGAVRQNLWGMWPHFLVFGAITSGCTLTGFLLGPYVSELPLRVLRGLAWAFPAMTAVAAAIAVRGSHARTAWMYASLSAVLVTVAVVGVWLMESR